MPAIWLPDPDTREARERARFRLHLVRHRTALKSRIHATLIAFGHPVPVSDLFGTAGRELLGRLDIPEPWATTLLTSLRYVDALERDIGACEAELRRLGADHPDIGLLTTIPGIAWVLGYTIAAEIGDISRFASPKKLVGYTGLCPYVHQSGGRDDHGAAVEERAQVSALGAHRDRHPCRETSRLPAALRTHEATARQAARQQGRPRRRRPPAATAIWHMLTKREPFRPGRPHVVTLVA